MKCRTHLSFFSARLLLWFVSVELQEKAWQSGEFAKAEPLLEELVQMLTAEGETHPLVPPSNVPYFVRDYYDR